MIFVTYRHPLESLKCALSLAYKILSAGFYQIPHNMQNLSAENCKKNNHASVLSYKPRRAMRSIRFRRSSPYHQSIFLFLKEGIRWIPVAASGLDGCSPISSLMDTTSRLAIDHDR